MSDIYTGAIPGDGFSTNLKMTGDNPTATNPENGPLSDEFKPTKATGTDETSGETYKKNFVQDSGYTTAGTDLEIRDAQRTNPTEIAWNASKC